MVSIKFFVVFIIVVMAENEQKSPASNAFDENEVDRLAEAVMVLRQSGLFNVEPIEREENPFRLNLDPLHDQPGLSYSPRRRYNHHDLERSPYLSDSASKDKKFLDSLLKPPTRFTANDSQNPYVDRAKRQVSSHQFSSTLRELPKNVMDPPVYGQIPRISTFTGSTVKGDVSFEAWKFEVRCLMRDKVYHRDLLLQSVRRSLKGEAGRLAMHLGEDASIESILRKLEGVYGTVESGATLLQQFYNSKQEMDESIAAYGCRLEDILAKAIDRGAIARGQADEMLRSKLWTGLKDERVKNATRYKYDQIRDFDSLRAELRAAEQEMRELDKVRGRSVRQPKATTATYMPQTSDQQRVSEGSDTVKKTLSDLTIKVARLEEKVSQQPDTKKMLDKILAKIQELEKKTVNSQQIESSGGKTTTRPSNSRGPLSRDRQ